MAIATALLQGLEPGDHILAPSDVYYGLRQVIGGVFAKWPLEATYVDLTDIAAVRRAVRPNTRLVLIETPSNPLIKITDLEAIARIAREVNAISVCDGTFTTPVLQRAGTHGCPRIPFSDDIANDKTLLGNVGWRSDHHVNSRCSVTHTRKSSTHRDYQSRY
jgi:cystathionine gamma-synthase